MTVSETTSTSTAAEAPRGRFLPRGLGDFVFQISLWLGFLLVYRVARGIADHGGAVTPVAKENARHVIAFESNVNALFELSLQKVLLSSRFLVDIAAATYWLSQFVVLGIALLWVYFRQTESFTRFRNWLMLANLVGLVGYVLVPTAPPRMFPNAGFLDVEALFSGLTTSSKGVSSLANPYAAMPSLHAADALIVGISMAYVCRRLWAKVLWLIWPLWVWFTVMATGNHFWLDCLAGVLMALAVAPVVDRRFRIWQRKAHSAPEAAAAPK
jgi:membrane-associated phospholipid phosphatase